MRPVYYNKISQRNRRFVREEYIADQRGLCCHCNEPLEGPASKEVRSHWVNKSLFPKGFFGHPVHLHHCHETGMTLGAVHCLCNAVLWQYHGE